MALPEGRQASPYLSWSQARRRVLVSVWCHPALKLLVNKMTWLQMKGSHGDRPWTAIRSEKVSIVHGSNNKNYNQNLIFTKIITFQYLSGTCFVVMAMHCLCLRLCDGFQPLIKEHILTICANAYDKRVKLFMVLVSGTSVDASDASTAPRSEAEEDGTAGVWAAARVWTDPLWDAHGGHRVA